MLSKLIIISLAICASTCYGSDSKLGGGSTNEPGKFTTAASLYSACSSSQKTCEEYMRSTFQTMDAHPEVYGELCKPSTPMTGGSYVRMYWSVGRQAWAKSATAHDAAIWAVQASLACHPGFIAAPGEQGFPTRMRGRNADGNDLLAKLKANHAAAASQP